MITHSPSLSYSCDLWIKFTSSIRFKSNNTVLFIVNLSYATTSSVFTSKMVFVHPLLYIISALNFYLLDRPILGNLAKRVINRANNRNREPNPPDSGSWREPVYVTTTQGRMKGGQDFSRIGHQFYWFRGIPYAKPPVGELRYEPPQPQEGWAGELDATMYGSECLQIDFFTRRVTGSEDCLYLNVATRKLPDSNGPVTKDGLYPVIFFIHGGLFMQGKSDSFGPRYFMDEEVVMVSINYRLNSFGFLNTGDGVVQGNMGMKDQVEALRWVQQNIQYFNGDPARVMLVGESAGAASVHLLTLSPLTRGLFSSAISQSGTALSPWAHIPNPGDQAREFGEGLGCPPSENGTESMIKCIKSKDAHTVASYHIGYLIAAAQGKNTLFAPTVDSGPSDQAFLPEHPLELMRSGKFSDRPFITGVNSGDGLVYLIAILRNETMRQYVNQEWHYIAPKLLHYRDHPNMDQVTDDISEYYLNNQGISQEGILMANDLLSDRGFFLDSHDVASLQSQVAPTYVYYYTYEGVFNGGNILYTKSNVPLPSDQQYLFGGAKVWIKSMLTNQREPAKYGICHGDEMPLLFNVPYLRREVLPGDADFDFSRKLVRLWVSFAETGVPDSSRDGGVQWDPVSAPSPTTSNDVTQPRLLLDENMAIVNEPYFDRLQFWRNHSISYLPE